MQTILNPQPLASRYESARAILLRYERKAVPEKTFADLDLKDGKDMTEFMQAIEAEALQNCKKIEYDDHRKAYTDQVEISFQVTTPCYTGEWDEDSENGCIASERTKDETVRMKVWIKPTERLSMIALGVASEVRAIENNARA